MLDALAVDDEEMIGARPPADVAIFAQLDVALGAQDGEAAVAPGAAGRRA